MRQATPKKTSPDLVKEPTSMDTLVQDSWSHIAPFWPLKSLVAVSPLKGFEHKSFEDALHDGYASFEQKNVPPPLCAVNRETLKWLQAFFDDNQATLTLPMRTLGLLATFLKLGRFDQNLFTKNPSKQAWFTTLPNDACAIISKTLLLLNIPPKDQALFLRLMLTTLSGWASYIQYRCAYDTETKINGLHMDYLALRLMITYLMWPDAAALLTWYKKGLQKPIKKRLDLIFAKEKSAHHHLLKQLLTTKPDQVRQTPSVQMAFCMDIRSEPFRRHLETLGSYETIGCAGFFGVPLRIEHEDGKIDLSYPALFETGESVRTHFIYKNTFFKIAHRLGLAFKMLYTSLTNTFTTPFIFSNIVGLWSGPWALLRTFFPRLAYNLQTKTMPSTHPPQEIALSLPRITLEKQTDYARDMLGMMGLTRNFAPLIVLCGHGSQAENNPHHTAFHCGACGGQHGGPNARTLAAILNNDRVRHRLSEHNVKIPKTTYFLAAEHNTTTDAVWLYDQNVPRAFVKTIKSFKQDLKTAQEKTVHERSLQKKKVPPSSKQVLLRARRKAEDWAETHPEWGCARNTSFIIGPRWLTKYLNLEGRTFLHSYNHEQDNTGDILTKILNSAMVVSGWINGQYLFSTLNPIAYGGGSKTTQNTIGAVGVMQGNGSDLMSGLCVQSTYLHEETPYHEPLRLLTVVYAPRKKVMSIIHESPLITRLVQNGWKHIACIDPEEKRIYTLQKNITWIPYVF